MTDTGSSSQNWDLFFGARTREINRALSKSVTITDLKAPPGDYGETVTATIDKWCIVDQIPGLVVTNTIRSNVIFELTLSDLVVSGGLFLQESEQVRVPLVHAYISMSLQFVREHEDSNTHLLVLDPPPAPDDKAESSLFSWSINKDDFTTKEGKDQISTVQAALDRWAAAHWADLAHVFHTIDVFAMGEVTQKAWLLPTAVDYAYAAAADPDDSVLCVFAMTQGRVPNHDRTTVLPTNLPADADAYIHIHRDLYLGSGILSAMTSIAPGAKVEQFAYSSDLGNITLAKGAIALPSVQAGFNAQTNTLDFPCPSAITDLKVGIWGDAILVQIETQVTVRELVHGPSWSQGHSNQTRPSYEDRDVCISYLGQTRYLTASVTVDAQGIPHMRIASDPARAKDEPHEEKAPEAMEDWVNNLLLNLVELVTAVVLPPLGMIEMLVTTAISTGEALNQEATMKDSEAILTGISIPDLLVAINTQWGGFDHFQPSDAAIDNGLSMIGKLQFPA
jgi:hypothetical protein